MIRRTTTTFALSLLLMLTACDNGATRRAAAITGGDPTRGIKEIGYYGCASCHTIPGAAGANGTVGPDLNGIGNRTFIGGVVKNNPGNLVRWIQNAPAVSPRTAMPDLEIPEPQARDIAAYLYSLQ